MVARRDITRTVITPHNAQPVGDHPIEHFTDPLTGRKLRRHALGRCASGTLGLSQVIKSTGIDLYFHNRHGTLPEPGEFCAALQQFLQQCWAQQICKPGKPKFYKLNANGVIWLASMPIIGRYGVDRLPGSGCELYRLVPLIRRPRG